MILPLHQQLGAGCASARVDFIIMGTPVKHPHLIL
jgi:hypothetical protein